MNRSRMITMCLFAMMAASLSVKAQEVTITLMPGWNWISVPLMDTLDFQTAMGTVTPVDGDIIKSHWGSAAYSNGQWRGTISQFYPGYGYHYKSNRTMPVFLTFTAQQPAPQVVVTTMEPTDITATSAVVSSTVTIGEGNHIFARCVCWDTESNPTIDNNHIAGEAVAGSQSVTLTELIPSTTYYVRAYVVTDYGPAYGEEQNFTTLDNSSNIPEGAINGLFTINDNGDQVYFSQGNLQYQASTNTWKFAENQWDYVGSQNPGYGNPGGTVTGSDNSNISSTYSGWIDLFGWGTSGYHDAIDPYNVNYQPWSTSISEVNSSYNYYGYGPSTNMTDPNLTGTSANYDWGVYNPISNGGNTANQWRTLTQLEWIYVFNTRATTSGIRYAKANVNNVNGVILLPDDWSTSTYSLSSTNTYNASFSSNTLTASQWNTLEQAGAVFMPAAGFRNGTSVNYVGSYGYYWSASYNHSNIARLVFFDDSNLSTGSSYRYYGRSVRLVCNAQ